MISTKWISGSEGLEEVHMIRTKVFIEEQKVSVEDEMDGTDVDAIHLLVYENGEPVATGRILKTESEPILGRIAVLKDKRGKQYGDLVVRMLIRKAYDMGAEVQRIHSQTQAVGFYKKLDFVVEGEEYMEAGIPHYNMVHKGDVGGDCQ